MVIKLNTSIVITYKIYKYKKPKKNPKKPKKPKKLKKNPKKPTGLVFFFKKKPGFFPTLVFYFELFLKMLL